MSRTCDSTADRPACPPADADPLTVAASAFALAAHYAADVPECEILKRGGLSEKNISWWGGGGGEVAWPRDNLFSLRLQRYLSAALAETNASNLAKQEDRWTCWTHKHKQGPTSVHNPRTSKLTAVDVLKFFTVIRSPQGFDTKLEHTNTNKHRHTGDVQTLNLLNVPICELLRNKSGAGDTS